jgi:two-component system response regulator AtoC
VAHELQLSSADTAVPGWTQRGRRLDHGTLMTVEINTMEASVEAGFVRGQGPAMRALDAAVANIARTDIAVLLVGESGTGKEVYARLIHRLSGAPGAAPKKINCATDAGRLRIQVLECLEHGNEGVRAGSLFLDGIEELDSASQRMLLALLPDGEPENRRMRVMSATSVELEKWTESGRFRRELYFRLNGARLRLPPLRERKEDIRSLVEYFLAKYAGDGQAPLLAEETIEKLQAHRWPGNIRELENLAKKMVAFSDVRAALSDLPVLTENATKMRSLEGPRVSSLKVAARAASRRTERELILEALERTHWNRKRAAEDLQISYKSLLYKIKQIGTPGPGTEEI